MAGRRFGRGSAACITVIVTTRAAPKRYDELLAVLREGRAFTLSVDGCTGFDVYRGLDDPHDVVMVEHWTTTEAHRTHFEPNVRDSGILDRVTKLLDGPLDQRRFQRD